MMMSAFTSILLYLSWILYATNAKLQFSGITFTNGRYCPNVTLDSPVAQQSLNHLVTTGANYVAVIVTQYQDNHQSTNIYPIYNTPVVCTDSGTYINCITATESQLVNVINYIHGLGMKVLLKPHVDLVNDMNYWRGNIGDGMTTQQWQEWFNSYQKFITYYASIATNTSVELFSVSCELITASKQEQYWRNQIIPEIKKYYSGPVFQNLIQCIMDRFPLNDAVLFNISGHLHSL